MTWREVGSGTGMRSRRRAFLTVMSDERIIMYGTSWCGDCHRAKATFQRLGVDYDYVDVDADDVARDLAIELSGVQRIPVILFPGGDVLVEPSDPVLAARISASA